MSKDQLNISGKREKKETRSFFKRSFVWYSRQAPRKEGKISVLAIFESLLAMGFYWWISLEWNNHWLLISSMLIAPLLLLRSPESIEEGIKCFLKSKFDFEHYATWVKSKKILWFALSAFVIFILLVGSFFFFAKLVPNPDEVFSYIFWFLFGALISAVIYSTMLTFVSLLSFRLIAENHIRLISILLSIPLGVFLWLVLGANMLGGTTYQNYLTVKSAVNALAVFTGLSLSLGLVSGSFLVVARAILCRICSTIYYIHKGIVWLPDNWWENQCVIDSTTSLELLPKLNQVNSFYSFHSRKNNLVSNNLKPIGILLLVSEAFIWFMPVMVYRLNIKATAWLYWVLAFLLRPIRVKDEEAHKKNSLCWPWTNPAMLIVFVSSIIVGVLATVGYLKPSLITQNIGAIPVWWNYIMAIDWAVIQPWHSAHLTIALISLLMLLLAGSAKSAYANGVDYNSENKWALPVMTGLKRIRFLAVMATIIFAVGAVLVTFKLNVLSNYLPEVVIKNLVNFYNPIT